MSTYPMKDKADRDGLYCTECESIFYVVSNKSGIVYDNPCPFCGGTILWITESEYPSGKGF